MIHPIKPPLKIQLIKTHKKPQHKAHKKAHRKIFKIVLTLLKL